MTRSFFCRVLAVTWLAPLAVLAQINITGVADKGTKKCPFDCFFFWQVVHNIHPIVAWF